MVDTVPPAAAAIAVDAEAVVGGVGDGLGVGVTPGGIEPELTDPVPPPPHPASTMTAAKKTTALRRKGVSQF